MARSSIDRDSLEYVHVPVTAPEGVLISGQAVSIAVVGEDSRPTSTDWQPAEWADTNVARVLVGPGELQLVPGLCKVWVRVTDSPETPVLSAGTIIVT